MGTNLVQTLGATLCHHASSPAWYDQATHPIPGPPETRRRGGCTADYNARVANATSRSTSQCQLRWPLRRQQVLGPLRRQTCEDVPSRQAWRRCVRSRAEALLQVLYLPALWLSHARAQEVHRVRLISPFFINYNLNISLQVSARLVTFLVFFFSSALCAYGAFSLPLLPSLTLMQD